MKFNCIKLTALILAVAVCLGLAGCGTQSAGAGNTVSIGYSSGRHDMIIDSSDKIKCDYLLVYHSTAGYAEIDACIDLLEKMSGMSKLTFQICPDTLTVTKPDQKIILLGSTSYGESDKSSSIINTIRRNNYYDYMLRAYDKVLTVNWVSKFGREAAFSYLTDTLLSNDLSAAFVDGYSHLYLSQRSDSPVVTVDDVNIVQYSVVLPGSPSYIERSTAELLVKAIKDATGTELPLVTDAVEESTYEILVGDTNRGATYVTSFFAERRFAVAEYGSKLILRGGNVESTVAAVSVLTDMITNAVITAEPVHLRAGYCKTGSSLGYTKNNFGGYTLRYSDEFNSTTIDSNIWNTPENAIPTYGSAPSIMYYDPKNVRLDGNNLIIRTYLGNDGYVTGAVDSYNKMRFKYGYFEVRAKFRTAPGYWVKLMLTDQMDRKDTVTQIDVFNSIATNESVFGSLGILSQEKYYQEFLKLNEPGYESYREGTLEYGQVLNDGEFHTYGMEWTPEYIKFYIDGRSYGTVETTDSKYKDLNKELYPEFFIGVEMTNQAADDEAAQWPADVTVDWVRLYQKEGQTFTLGSTEKSE